MQFHFENNAFICKCCSFLSVIRNRILCCDPHPKRQLTSQTFELVSLEILLALNIVGWILQNRNYRGFVALLNICARSELHAFKSFMRKYLHFANIALFSYFFFAPTEQKSQTFQHPAWWCNNDVASWAHHGKLANTISFAIFRDGNFAQRCGFVVVRNSVEPQCLIVRGMQVNVGRCNRLWVEHHLINRVNGVTYRLFGSVASTDILEQFSFDPQRADHFCSVERTLKIYKWRLTNDIQVNVVGHVRCRWDLKSKRPNEKCH